MKRLILLIFLSFLIVPGCTFLRGEDDLSQEEFSEAEEGIDEEEDIEEEEEFSEFDEEDVEEEEDIDEEFAEIEEEEEEGGGLTGFFSRIFGFSDDEDDEEWVEEEGEFVEGEADYEGDYVEEKADYEDESIQDEVASLIEGGDEVSSQEASTKTASLAKQSPKAETQAPKTPTEKPKPALISLKKIKSAPYRKMGNLVNAVYIARPGETLKDISQKIYGSDQLSALYAINPHLKSRSVKVGDKIYYNSPLRKEDDSRLLFYYQDINAPSSIYTLSSGDNIRQVASQLLGHPDSWKEIWATNPELESKGQITSSASIVYWAVGSAAAEKASPIDIASEQEPIQLEDKPLEEVFPPVEKKPDKIEVSKKTTNVLGMLKQKEIILILFVIIILLILMLRLFLKKRKQKDFDYTATNIEV